MFFDGKATVSSLGPFLAILFLYTVEEKVSQHHRDLGHALDHTETEVEFTTTVLKKAKEP